MLFCFFIYIFTLMSKSDGYIGKRFCVDMRCEFPRKLSLDSAALVVLFCFLYVRHKPDSNTVAVPHHVMNHSG